MENIDSILRLSGSKENSRDSNVTIDMLDYDFIQKCNDVELLKSIVRRLRSRTDGYFKQLEDFAISSLIEKMPVRERYQVKAMLKEPDQHEILDSKKSLINFEKSMERAEKDMTSNKSEAEKVLPPVRNSFRSQNKNEKTSGQATIASRSGPTVGSESHKFPERISGYDFKGWEKFAAEKDENGRGEQQESGASNSIHVIESKTAEDRKEKRRKEEISSALMSDVTALSFIERKIMSEKERIKGNECLNANEVLQARTHYTKSIAFLTDVKADNEEKKEIIKEQLSKAFCNRALTNLKLDSLEDAELDCSESIKIDDTYMKAWMRRGAVRHKRGRYLLAIRDFEQAVSLNVDDKQRNVLAGLIQKSKQKLVEVEGEAAHAQITAATECQKTESASISSEDKPPKTLPHDASSVSKNYFKRIIITEASESNSNTTGGYESDSSSEGDAPCTKNGASADSIGKETSQELNSSQRSLSSKETSKVGEKRSYSDGLLKHPVPLKEAARSVMTADEGVTKSSSCDPAEEKLSSNEPPLNGESSSFRKIKVEADTGEASNVSQSDWFKLQGNELMKKKDIEGALAMYDKSVELNPGNAAAFSNRSQCHILLQDWNAAESDASSVLQLPVVPQNLRVKALYRRGLSRLRIAQNLEQSDEPWSVVKRKRRDLMKASRNDIESMLNVEPKNKEALKVLSEIGSYEAELKQQSPKGMTRRISFSDGTVPGAEVEADMDQLIRDHHLKKMHPDLAETHWNSEELQDENIHAGAAALNRESIRSLNESSGTKFQQQDFDGCIEDASKVLEMDGQNAAALHRRSMAYFSKGELAQALADLESALKVEPTNENLQRSLERTRAAILAEEKRDKAAVTEALKFIEKSVPKNPPKTFYEFERVWRDLKGHDELCLQYLGMIKGSSLNKVADKVLASNPEIFSQVIRLLSGEAAGSSDNLQERRRVLRSFGKSSRVDFAIEMLSAGDKQALANIVQRTVSDAPDDAPLRKLSVAVESLHSR